MGQPNNETIELYRSPNGGLFTLDSIPGVRDYSKRDYLDIDKVEDIKQNDRIIRVTANQYWYKTDDIGLMIKYLLSNKRIVGAREIEANKLYKWIRECFTNSLF